MNPRCPERRHYFEQQRRQKTNFLEGFFTGKKVKPKKLSPVQELLLNEQEKLELEWNDLNDQLTELNTRAQ